MAELPLADLRIVEVSAFVAAPIGSMTLARLGADVIRIDPIGGNIDITRWPVTAEGKSLYWAGLNKGKRSVALALHTPEGREIAEALITLPGENSGILLTNLSTSGWMSYAALSAKRPDLIMLALTGNADGTTAVDYTIQCAGGFPSVTGTGDGPVNSVLPAWDVATGLYISTGLLAAERQRHRTGKGREIKLSLSDVMLATIGDLGLIAEVEINRTARTAIGNDLYGAFGRDFATADGRRVMIVAISTRQWKAIGKATGLAAAFDRVQVDTGLNLDLEGERFQARDAIAGVLAPWCAARTLQEIRGVFEGSGVLWGPYQTFGQLVAEDPRCSPLNPMFGHLEQPGIGRYLTPRSPLRFGAEMEALRPAPRLGEHTDNVLAEVLGFSASQIGALHDRGIIAGP